MSLSTGHMRCGCERERRCGEQSGFMGLSGGSRRGAVPLASLPGASEGPLMLVSPGLSCRALHL